MEHYELRSCYMADLAGLHLRIYQYQQLLSQHLPQVAQHLEALKVEPLYVSQWFLSFFAVTCPLSMLHRIYDVVLSEGATETLMRVALSLMKRNEEKILACAEFEDAMQFLLSPSLWDTYAQQADELVTEFAAWTTVVTHDSLKSLEVNFNDSKALAVAPTFKITASNFLGRFWTGSAHSTARSGTGLMFAPPSPSRPTSMLRKSASKQSLSSTDNSDEATSDTSTLATEVSTVLQKSDTMHSDSVSVDRGAMSTKERELENQIEDLLKAMSDMQHRQNDLFSELQREKEERQEDRDITTTLLRSFKTLTEDVRSVAGEDGGTDQDHATENLISQASLRFAVLETRRASILQSKHQLRDEAADWKEKHDQEAARCQELSKQLDEGEKDQNSLRDQLREARARIQDAHKDKQRLEKTIQELRNQRSSGPSSPHDVTHPSLSSSSVAAAATTATSDQREPRGSTASSPGLREFKLGRTGTDSSLRSPVFNKRSSSLNVAAVGAAVGNGDGPAPVPSPTPDPILLGELANAKTSEALAKQELEEVKGKLEALKKLVVNTANPSSSAAVVHSADNDKDHLDDTAPSSKSSQAEPVPIPAPATSSAPSAPLAATPPAKASTSSSSISITNSAGNFFSSWTRRAASASASAA